MSEKLTGYPSIDKPWLKYYSDEAINAPLPECSIYEYLYRSNKEYPNDRALNYFNRIISYKELFELIDKTAQAFLSFGVKEGDIVTVALPSIPEVVYAVYALNKIGAVANMIHPLAGENELINYFNEVNSKVAVIFDGTYKIVKDSLDKTSLKHIIVVSASDSLPTVIKTLYLLKNKRVNIKDNNKLIDWKSFIRHGVSCNLFETNRKINEVAIISHTGGTTGEPKGVMCSDKNVNALTWQIGALLTHSRQNKCLVVLPPFVNYSLVDGILGPLTLGIEVILIPDYKPEKIIEYCKKYSPNIISSIPAYWEALLSIDNVLEQDLSCLEHVFSGGEAMDAEKEKAINNILLSCGAKRKLSMGLGCTEVVSAATFTHEDSTTVGSVGIPMVKVNCKIVEPMTKKEVPLGEEGEICFAGPTVMIGYYQNKKATDDVIKIHSDGERWIHTGDLGKINENGELFVTGRIKRIIMTKGEDKQVTKIFPDRVESVINSNEAVKICCVIGVPDKERINYPKAFIILNEGIAPDNSVKNDVLFFCKKHLPEYMIPTEIEFLKDFPRTARGKIDYRTLEKQAEELNNH